MYIEIIVNADVDSDVAAHRGARSAVFSLQIRLFQQNMPLFTLGAGSLKMCFHQFHQLLSQVRINYDSWLHHINATSLTSPANLIDLSRISGSWTHSKRQVSTDFAACHPLRNISRLAPIAPWVRNTYVSLELNWLVAST